ncbi:MAG TPA: glycosyltransferase family 4 protein [Rhodanobacteraceae bacterium]|nr:glycosyltransferase family 4 protein [Rhodanobacteraceae bacterium]
MKILLVSKRHPQQRDLIERPYGRFYWLPTMLAATGHDVHTILCSHRRLPAAALDRDGVHWTSLDIRTLGPAALLSRIKAEAQAFQPDWIVGLSDAWYGWLAHWLARKTGARLAIDAYDNYEAYMPWNLPLHWKWHRALHAADVVTAAGPQLAELLDRQRHGKSRTVVVPMAADPVFKPHGREAARRALGLPGQVPLVGYCGSWANNRGTDILLAAFRLIRASKPDAQLVLTGNPPPHARAEPGVLATGYVKDEQLPLVLSALDVACVITSDTSFGRYSYPAKLCEAMACQVPVVATATGPVRWMLGDGRRCLVPTGDAPALANRVLAQLGCGNTAYSGLPSWEDSAARFESALLSAARGTNA